MSAHGTNTARAQMVGRKVVAVNSDENGDIDIDDFRQKAQANNDNLVVVGRGCLGRPWLFGELERSINAYLNGQRAPTQSSMPSLGEVADAFYRHAQLLTEFCEEENRACRDIRKHVAWYFKGYPVGGELRAQLAMASSLAEIAELLGQLDRTSPYPGEEAEGPRGRLGGVKSCSLPENWLDSQEVSESHRSQLELAELSVTGG